MDDDDAVKERRKRMTKPLFFLFSRLDIYFYFPFKGKRSSPLPYS